MLYSYKDCKQIYRTDYALRNAVSSGELIKISRGIYSDNGKEYDLSVICSNITYVNTEY